MIEANSSDILTDFGDEVRTAHNGRDALKLADVQRFDIVLLDLKMPDMDGLEFYHELKRLAPTTVALLITGFADSETERRAAQIGVWRVLPKPLDVELLMPLVQQASEQPLLLLVDDVTAMTQVDVLFYKPLDVEPFLETLFRLMSC